MKHYISIITLFVFSACSLTFEVKQPEQQIVFQRQVDTVPLLPSNIPDEVVPQGYGSVRPDQAQEKLVAEDDDEIYSQYSGILRRIKFSTAKTYFQQGVVDSIALLQDSIIVVFKSGVETHRDTIAGVGGGDSGTDDQTLSFVGTTLSIEDANSVNLSSLQDGTGTDDQTIDVLSLAGTTLSLSLENDGQASQTVDLSSLQDGTGTDDQTAVEVPFSPTGNILSSDVQSMGEELQTQIDGLQTTSGVSNGATNLGTFSGSTISDNTTTKAALQELETAVESSGGSTQVATISDLSSLSPSDNDRIYVEGYYSQFDGGQGYFVYDANLVLSTTNANSGSIIDPASMTTWDGTQADINDLITEQSSSTNTGAWVREGSEFTGYQFGLTNNNAIVQSEALKNFLESSYGEVLKIEGDFDGILLDQDPILPAENMTITGYGSGAFFDLDVTGDPDYWLNGLFRIRTDNVKIANITITNAAINESSSVPNRTAIFIDDSGTTINNTVIEKVVVHGFFTNGFSVQNTFNTRILNCNIKNSRFGIYMQTNEKMYIEENTIWKDDQPADEGNLYGEGIKFGVNVPVNETVYIIKNKFFDLGRDGIDLTGGSDFLLVIDQNTFSNMDDNALDIKTTYGDGASAFANINGDNRIEGLRITNNTFDRAGIVFVVSYNDATTGNDLSLITSEMSYVPTLISNNTFIDCGGNFQGAAGVTMNGMNLYGACNFKFRLPSTAPVNSIVQYETMYGFNISNAVIERNALNANAITFEFEDISNVRMSNIVYSENDNDVAYSLARFTDCQNIQIEGVNAFMKDQVTGNVDLFYLLNTQNITIENVDIRCVNCRTQTDAILFASTAISDITLRDWRTSGLGNLLRNNQTAYTISGLLMDNVKYDNASYYTGNEFANIKIINNNLFTSLQTSDLTVAIGEYNLVDPNGGAITATVPSGVTQVGTEFWVVDSEGTASGTNTITVDFSTNGYTVSGSNVINTAGESKKFIYIGSNKWIIE